MATETLEIKLPASVKDLVELIYREEYVEPTKQELIVDLKEATEEVNLHTAGKIKLRTLEELIEEMEEEENYVKLPKRELIKKLILANEKINYYNNLNLISSLNEELIKIK